MSSGQTAPLVRLADVIFNRTGHLRGPYRSCCIVYLCSSEVADVNVHWTGLCNAPKVVFAAKSEENPFTGLKICNAKDL